jgi:hypothetical protein
MSWSIDITGKPENVAAALDELSEKFNGVSREEFDAAKPHLQALVRENFGRAEGYIEPILRLRASGSGHSKDGEHLQRSFGVTLEPSYSQLV